MTYKNKTYFNTAFEVVIKGKKYILHEFNLNQINQLLNKLETFLYKKIDLHSKYSINFEKNDNKAYASNTVYENKENDKAVIDSLEKEIKSIKVVFSKIVEYREHISKPITLRKNDSVFIAQNIDEIEISLKIKEGYKFEDSALFKAYLNRKFVKSCDLTKVKGKRKEKHEV